MLASDCVTINVALETVLKEQIDMIVGYLTTIDRLGQGAMTASIYANVQHNVEQEACHTPRPDEEMLVSEYWSMTAANTEDQSIHSSLSLQ